MLHSIKSTSPASNTKFSFTGVASALSRRPVKGKCLILRKCGATHLYNLFRSSFLKDVPYPLSSDAFSGFGRINCRENNEQVRQATRLLKERIRKFADDLNTQKVLFSSPANLIEVMHDRGINCRHLAMLRGCIKSSTKKSPFLNTTVTKVLFTECVFRTLKSMLRMELRKATPQTAASIAARFLNNVFLQKSTKVEDDTSSLSYVFKGLTGKHNAFWQLNVRTALMLKYGGQDFEESFHVVSNGLLKHVLQLNLFDRLTSNTTGVYVIPKTKKKWTEFFGKYGILSENCPRLTAEDMVVVPSVRGVLECWREFFNHITFSCFNNVIQITQMTLSYHKKII